MALVGPEQIDRVRTALRSWRSKPPRPTVVRAAGGVPWRRRGADLEVRRVHRPRYDDWSLPKGKCEGDEEDTACALREVAEETGLSCTLGPELPGQRYRDHKGRDKVVRYWAMEAPDGEGVLEHEVDEVAWLALPAARARLSYPRDAAVLDALPSVLDGSWR